MQEVEILEYLDPAGRSPCRRDRVDAGEPQPKCGEGVGADVYEYKIDFGPGYRIDFGKDGERIVILLGGSTKKRQSAAIMGGVQTGELRQGW